MVVAATLALCSIDTPTARSQPAAGSAEAPTAEHNADQADDDDAATGSAGGLHAPADPKARAEWLRDKLTAAITSHPTLSKAKIAVAVYDLATNSELFAHAADQGMNLASNAKLLTTIAALGTLGGGFRWKTSVYADAIDDATGKVKGDLYVRGRGDPTLSLADLRALADDVAARGVRAVDGKLIVDVGYFDGNVEPPHYTDQPKERAGYRAPVASFGVAHSAVTVIVAAEPGGKAKVTLEPDAGDYVKLVKSEVKSTTTGHTRIRIDAKPKADHLELEVTGEIRAATGSYDARKRVDDPARFAAEVFRHALAERGVKIAKRGVGAGTIPPAAKLVASHDSAPLAMIVREMNKLSDNYVAESVLKTLGAETRTTPVPRPGRTGPPRSRPISQRSGSPRGAIAPRTARGSTARARSRSIRS